MLKYNVDDVVVIGKCLCSHGFEIGSEVRITGRFETDEHYAAEYADNRAIIYACYIGDDEIDHVATTMLKTPVVTKLVPTSKKQNKTEKKFESKVVTERKPTIRQNVEVILRDVPDTRNDDKLLILMYWKNYDNILNENGLVSPADVLNIATTPESLTRARRMIQEEGLYPPTEPAVIARRSKERKMLVAVKQGEVV